MDVLYGESKERQGYLVDLEQKPKHGLFCSKTFPVTYFVILDTIPYRDRSVLARNVSWATLRAQGYAEGKYTLAKYALTSDTLFERCARERYGMGDSEDGRSNAMVQCDVRRGSVWVEFEYCMVQHASWSVSY